MDFNRALPLAMELMARIKEPGSVDSEFQHFTMNNVLDTFTSIDPRGYQEDLEQGFVSLNEAIAAGPNIHRFVLYDQWVNYLDQMEEWERGYELSLHTISLIEASKSNSNRIWHGASALHLLCPICYHLRRFEELEGHAEILVEKSKKQDQLRALHADGIIWTAFSHRMRGEERKASRLFHRGMNWLTQVVNHDALCGDSIRAYYDACGDIEAIIGVCDRELNVFKKNGMLHKTCKVEIERCQLLRKVGRLTDSDLDRARQSTQKLLKPDWYLKKIETLAASRNPE
jgi:hypothetical protein